MAEFQPDIYRLNNPDLGALSDEEILDHFDRFGRHEPRIFANVAPSHDRFSMRWLRGKGIEIGGGPHPTSLFGDASVVAADCDPTHWYGGARSDEIFEIDGDLPDRLEARFDFAVASHVIEHADSLIRAMRNLIALVKPGGVIYIAAPCVSFSPDGAWMPHFAFAHHIEEFNDPLKYKDLHDKLFLDGQRQLGKRHLTLGPKARFMTHKHNYDFHDWLSVILATLEFLGAPARLIDSGFGADRQDANLVLRRGQD